MEKRKNIPFKVRKLVFETGDWRCFYCYIDLNTLIPAERTIDHIIPVYEGGDNNLYNLIPSCKSCNSARGGLTTLEYVQRIIKEPVKIKYMYKNSPSFWREEQKKWEKEKKVKVELQDPIHGPL